MARIDDVLLNAYIDGELGHEDATEVTTALRLDPEAGHRLAVLKRMDTLIHEAFDPILEEQIPERLLAAAQTKMRPLSAYRVVLAALPIRSAIAAGLAVCCVVAGTYAGTAWYLTHTQDQVQALQLQDRVIQNSAIQYALEQERSGTVTQWRNPDSGRGGTVVPIRTFQDNSGKFCREFQMTFENPEGKALRDRLQGQSQAVFEEIKPILAVACRGNEGIWTERFRVIMGAEENLTSFSKADPESGI
ncbi:MAG: RT0821/Lpp0805 family surface protein [Alphaproteobacteria bacterium]